MEESITGFLIIMLAIVVFVIYFYVKVIQFFLVSVNLYKKMVTRQDATVKLLLDIRNNTKTYTALIDEDDLDEDDLDEDESLCKQTKEKPPEGTCQKCGYTFVWPEKCWKRDGLIVCYDCSKQESV